MSVANIKYLYFMLLVLLLAFALGARGLNFDIVWSDEVLSLMNIGAYHLPYGQPASPAQTVALVQEYGPDHVPLFYVMAATWASFTGWSQATLRALALFAGAFMLAWMYRFAADTLDRRTAVLAALLMSTSPFVIAYFHELRAYTLLMATASMHCCLYWRLCHRRSNSRLLWLTFAMTTTVLFYTHNLALMLVAALGICHLVIMPRSRAWYGILAAWILGALPFVPYLPNLFAGEFVAFGANDRSLPTFDLAIAWATVLVNGYVVLWLPIVVAFGFVLRRGRKRAIVQIGIVALITCLGLFAANWRYSIIPITRLRYFLIAWWLIVILFAYSLAALPRWKHWATGFFLLWSAAGFFFVYSGRILEYTGFISFARTYPPMHIYTDNLKGKVKHTDYVVGFTEESWVNHDGDYRRGHHTKDYYFGLQLGIDGEFIDVNMRPWEIKRDISNILSEYPEVLLVFDPQKYLTQVELASSTIQEVYFPCAVIVKRPDLIVQRFAHPVLSCGHEATPIEYETGITVVDYDARFDKELERVEALIRWQVPDASMLDQFNMSLQLVTPEWENVRQLDRHLSDGLVPWSVSELSTAGLKTGDYRLMLVLYNRDTGERFVGVDKNSDETAKILPLLSLNV